jgi:hypothetical protein
MIPVLFCHTRSNYHLFDCEVFDKKKDAFTFSGAAAIIAHPPCAQWSRLRNFSKYVPLERFAGPFAIAQVRKNGGIVEHPNGSALFKACNIPRSTNQDQYGGFLISVNQHWFGHPCKKETLLYIVGIRPGQLPALPLNFDAITHKIGDSSLGRKEASKRIASHPPVKFSAWLLQIALLIEQQKSK